VRSAEELGRVRLSQSFFMRDFLYSEIANLHGLVNLPDVPDLALEAGRALCQNLLEPLQETFGRLAIRSAYRSPCVNDFGNRHFSNCASNERDRARHIWDQRSADGGMGAMATIVVPWLVDQLPRGTSWQAMAWWIHDNLPYGELQFFPKLAAFNIGWHEFPRRLITSFTSPRGLLTKPGMANHEGDHSKLYEGFPPVVWQTTHHDPVTHPFSACNSGLRRCHSHQGAWRFRQAVGTGPATAAGNRCAGSSAPGQRLSRTKHKRRDTA
jgi:hypothetical protein